LKAWFQYWFILLRLPVGGSLFSRLLKVLVLASPTFVPFKTGTEEFLIRVAPTLI